MPCVMDRESIGPLRSVIPVPGFGRLEQGIVLVVLEKDTLRRSQSSSGVSTLHLPHSTITYKKKVMPNP